MGKIKISIFLICAFLLTGIFSSCGTEDVEPIEVKVSVKFVYEDKVVGEYDNILVRSEDGNPTVINAVERACEVLLLPYEISDDGMMLISVDEYAETETGIWLWKINGTDPSDDAGKAGSYEIKEGDKIEYYFEDIVATS